MNIRDFSRPTVWGILFTAVLTLAALPAKSSDGAGPDKQKKLRVVVLGAHPDDPESGCGGLIAMLTNAGHEVVVGYTTSFRGQRKIGGQDEAVVRRAEAAKACAILKAKPYFFEYAHEKLQADEGTLKAVSTWLDATKPDIVVTHWPLDTHPNHHVTGTLAWQRYLQKAEWSLYFFEVMTDQQTLLFRPDQYLDCETVMDLKKKALACHESQGPEAIWNVHEIMARRRGSECGVTFAEAYTLVRPARGPTLPIPMLDRKK